MPLRGRLLFLGDLQALQTGANLVNTWLRWGCAGAPFHGRSGRAGPPGAHLLLDERHEGAARPGQLLGCRRCIIIGSRSRSSIYLGRRRIGCFSSIVPSTTASSAAGVSRDLQPEALEDLGGGHDQTASMAAAVPVRLCLCCRGSSSYCCWLFQHDARGGRPAQAAAGRLEQELLLLSGGRIGTLGSREAGWETTAATCRAAAGAGAGAGKGPAHRLVTAPNASVIVGTRRAAVLVDEAQPRP